MIKSKALTVIAGLCGILAYTAGSIGVAQVVEGQAVDANGAPQYHVDPFWPKPLPNQWSMQQVTGLYVDHMEHIWFINRGRAALPIELAGELGPGAALCCVRGPEIIELDQEGNVLNAWGGPGYHPLWPEYLQTVIPDSEGFVWIAGEAAQDSILKFTREGEFVWDFGRRPPKLGTEADYRTRDPQENNQNVDEIVNVGRFQLDEVDNELYIIDQKRVTVYDASTGDFKRGWGGHGMPLSEITNEPIAGYEWTGEPPPEERNFAPTLHFIEISNDRRVYIGERGQNRIQVFTTEGEWLQDIYVSPNTPAQRGLCAGMFERPASPMPVGTFYASICGSMYKMIISKDPEQKYLFVADAHNDVVWSVDRLGGETLGYFGRNGRLAGQFHFANAIGIDTFGNIFVGEVDNAKRIQKFAPVMMGVP
ncbi:MAG: hypothetical protein ACJ0S4_06445 [Candidatus Rariloculaceae bacterium]